MLTSLLTAAVGLKPHNHYLCFSAWQKWHGTLHGGLCVEGFGVRHQTGARCEPPYNGRPPHNFRQSVQRLSEPRWFSFQTPNHRDVHTWEDRWAQRKSSYRKDEMKLAVRPNEIFNMKEDKVFSWDSPGAARPADGGHVSSQYLSITAASADIWTLWKSLTAALKEYFCDILARKIIKNCSFKSCRYMNSFTHKEQQD